MPVDTYAMNELFRLTVIKHHVNNPADAWANTYEFKALASGTIPQLRLLAGRLANFEEDFAFDTTVFDRVVIATWEADSAPYNPSNFAVYPLGVTGAVAAAVGPVGLGTCLHVVRTPVSGRLGHLFFRNCLTEADVSAPAGIDVLTNMATTAATFLTSITTAGLDEHFTGGEEDLEMVMIDELGSVVRGVGGLSVTGVSRVKTDHKWYNRAGSP